MIIIRGTSIINAKTILYYSYIHKQSTLPDTLPGNWIKHLTLYKVALFDAKSARRSERAHSLLDIINGSKIKFHR